MANLTDSDLRDPSPPVPGAAERAAVAARARQLGRRRRVLQGAGALGMVAAVAVGVAALTAGGTSSGPGGQRIEAASSPADARTGVTTTTTAPDPTTVPPAPAPSAGGDGAGEVSGPAPVTGAAPPVAASVFTVSGTVSNVPAGVTVTLTLTGANGTFTAVADASGHYAIGGVPAGDYQGAYSWESTEGSAAQVGRLGGVSITGDIDMSFALQ
jgi:hypothetical protein